MRRVTVWVRQCADRINCRPSTHRCSAGDTHHRRSKTSATQGEILDPARVRSSVAWHLGIYHGVVAAGDDAIEGIVHITLDSTQRYGQAPAEERLLEWHAALFLTGVASRPSPSVPGVSIPCGWSPGSSAGSESTSQCRRIARRWARICHCSQEEAGEDVAQLMTRGLLVLNPNSANTLAGLSPALAPPIQSRSKTGAPPRRRAGTSPDFVMEPPLPVPPDNDIGNSREEHGAQVMTDFGASPAQATTAATGRPAKGAKEWKAARTAGRK